MAITAPEFIELLNKSWRHGHWDTLASLYHPDAVLLPPDAGNVIVGRKAILQTYHDFNDAATLDQFEVRQLDVFSFGELDMIHMKFELTYQLEGQTFCESGLEVYALKRTPDPQIVWRSQDTLDQRNVDS